MQMVVGVPVDAVEAWNQREQSDSEERPKRPVVPAEPAPDVRDDGCKDNTRGASGRRGSGPRAGQDIGRRGVSSGDMGGEGSSPRSGRGYAAGAGLAGAGGWQAFASSRSLLPHALPPLVISAGSSL